MKVLVSGRVQGVFYRAFTRQNAEQLGLSGWVKNLEDGRVEAEIEGSRQAIERMLTKMGRGPPGARVDDIETEEIKERGEKGFEIL